MGLSIREIARRLFKPYSTIRDWLVKLHRQGPRGRFNKRRGCRKRILNNAILKGMKRWLSEKPGKYGFKSGNWHLDMVKVMLEQNHGVVCSDRTLRRALRKIHFSYRKASGTVPHNSAIRRRSVASAEPSRSLPGRLPGRGPSRALPQDSPGLTLPEC